MHSPVRLMQTLLSEFSALLARDFNPIRREVAFKSINNKIDVAIGMRRTGKTSFLIQAIRELLAQQVSLNQVLYINFEDERLLPMSAKECGALLDSFYAIYPENHEKECYLFLDEIQNVDEWPLVVRRYLDSKKVKIFLSGSSAKLLSKEIATSLRGRSISTEIWPFSFQEYLVGKQVDFPPALMGQKERDLYIKHLSEFLLVGGFPEVQNLDKNDRRLVLQEYVDTVIFRDIIERHHIKNIPLIKYLVKIMLQSMSCNISISKLLNDFNSQGLRASKNTLYEYLDYIEDVFLAFRIPMYSESYRRMQTNLKKTYVVDSGLSFAYSTQLMNNVGRSFENLIYLDLRRQGYEIYYYKTTDNYEVDFFAQSPEGKFRLFQVVWDVSDKKTYEREMRALKQAEQETGFEGILVDPVHYLDSGVMT